MLGVFVIPFFLGMISQNVYKKYMKHCDIYTMSIYFFFIIGIFFSYIQSPFTDKKFAFALILLMLLKKREKEG